MNWSPNKISFLLDDVMFYTYNPSVKDASRHSIKNNIFIEYRYGGVAGAIASDFVKVQWRLIM
jgi:hypothetical protein